MRTSLDTGFSGPDINPDKRTWDNPAQGTQGCYNLEPTPVSVPLGKSACPELDAYYAARLDKNGEAIPNAPPSKIIGKESGINT